MDFASLLLVTTTLITPGPAPVAGGPAIVATDLAAPADRAADQRDRQRDRQGQSSSSARPRRGLGVGGNLSASNRGVGGNVRYWFSDRLGVSFAASWYRGRTTSGIDRGSTTLVAPSVIYLFTASDPSKDVQVRPYAGVGLNYARAGAAGVRATPGTTTPRTSGTGVQAFGGVEMTFREMPNLAVTAEVAYYQLPSTFLNRGMLDGTNFLIGVYYYF